MADQRRHVAAALAGGRDADHHVVLPVRRAAVAAKPPNSVANRLVPCARRACAPRRPGRRRATWSMRRCEGAHRAAAAGRAAARAPAACRRRSARASSALAPAAARRCSARRLGQRVVGECVGRSDRGPRPGPAARRRAAESPARSRPTTSRRRRCGARSAPARGRRRRAGSSSARNSGPCSRSKGSRTAAQASSRALASASAGRRRRSASSACKPSARRRRIQHDVPSSAKVARSAFVAVDQRVQRGAARPRRARRAAQADRLVVGQRGLGAELVGQPDLALRLGGRDDARRSRPPANGSKSTAPSAGFSELDGAHASHLHELARARRVGHEPGGLAVRSRPRRASGTAGCAASNDASPRGARRGRKSASCISATDSLKADLMVAMSCVRVRGGQEAREVVEDVHAAAAHHREQQVLQRMVFEPADAPERGEVADLERRADLAAERALSSSAMAAVCTVELRPAAPSPAAFRCSQRRPCAAASASGWRTKVPAK